MADSPLSTDPLERYGAIERAYCEENWSAVIHDGQTMLADLSRAEGVSPEGLKERLELLIAHSFLYGLGDRDSAEDLYQAVLHSGAEASLRQIAEQGLQQCALPVAPPELQEVEQPLEPEGEPSGSLSSPDAGASGWPEPAAVASPAESTGVPQAAPASALQEESAPLQGLQDSWATEAAEAAEAASPPSEEAPLPPDESSPLSWLTAEPMASPKTHDSAALPVMPWLETEAAAATAAVPGVLPERAIHHAEDAPLRQEEPLEPGSGSLFTEAGALPEVPVSMPPADLLEVPPPSADVQQTAPPSSEGVEGSPTSPPASAAEERLVADVVEEPELIELYQARGPAPLELLAQPVAESVAPSAVVEGETQASAPAEPELSAGIERRRMDSLPGDVLDRRAEPEPEREPAPELELAPMPAPPEEPAPRAASPGVPVASGGGPFSAPPEPVAEEDPELLLGLLKVEMG